MRFVPNFGAVTAAEIETDAFAEFDSSHSMKRITWFGRLGDLGQ